MIYPEYEAPGVIMILPTPVFPLDAFENVIFIDRVVVLKAVLVVWVAVAF